MINDFPTQDVTGMRENKCVRCAQLQIWLLHFKSGEAKALFEWWSEISWDLHACIVSKNQQIIASI